MPTFKQKAATGRAALFTRPGHTSEIPCTIYAVNQDGTCDLLVPIPAEHDNTDPRNLTSGRGVYAVETYLVKRVARGFGPGKWHFFDDSAEDPKPEEAPATPAAPADPNVAELESAVTQPPADAPAATTAAA